MKVVFIIFCLTMVGCASTTNKIPAEKGINSYFIKDVNVNLSLGHGAIDGDVTFATQEVLKQQFQEALNKYLIENNINSSQATSNSASLVITIDFLRRFNTGGKALNKPEISHKVAFYQDEENIYNQSRKSYTTKYGYFQNLAVDLEIAAFQWDAEDEPKDVDLISKMIVDDLVTALGK